MDRSGIRTAFILCMALSFVAAVAATQSAEAAAKFEQPVIGEVSDNNTIVSEEGKVYALTGKNADALQRYEGQKVRVMGMVKEDGDQPSIDVSSYGPIHEGQEEKLQFGPEGRSGLVY
ncbi:MAG: hypothetical protein AB1640_09895 [bacterium]